MASPAQDILDAQRRLSSVSIGPVRADEQAAAGVSAALLRNAPTAQANPYGPGTAPKPGMPGRTVDLKSPAPGGILKRTGRAIAGAPTNAVSGTMSLLRSPTVLGAGGTAVAAVPEALRTGEVLANPRATWNDVGTQAAEGVGRLGAAAAGAAGGMTLGAGLGSIVPGVGTAIGGLAGGALGGLYGYWAGDKAIRGLRGAAGVDTRSPAVQLGAPVEPTRVQQLTGEKPTIASGPARPDAPVATEPAYRDEGRNYSTATTASELRAPNLDGKIVRNGNSYSGSNIKFGADIVDPKGNLINGGDPNNPKGFGVSSLDTSAGYQADLRELARLRAERSERETVTGGVTDLGGRGASNIRSVTPETIARDEMQSAMRAMAPRERAQAAMQQAQLAQRMAEAQMGNAATLRGQDIGASTTMRGQDIGASTARRSQDITARGQDMDYAEKIDARMMDLMARRQLRDVNSEIFKAANGDPTKMMRMAAGMGLPIDPYVKLAEFDDKRTKDSDEAIERTARALAPTDDKGKPIEGEIARIKVALKQGSNLQGATASQVAAAEPQLVTRQRVLNSMNAARDTGWLQAVGFDNPSPAYTALPDLRGASAERVGFFEGALTPNVSKGDYKLTKPGESTRYLRDQDIDDFALRELQESYGLRLPGR